ncbi:OprD family porin [Pseudomonas putida]
MSQTSIASLCLTATVLLNASCVSAELLDDSKSSLEFRNFYMNKDFRQTGAAQSKAEEWAQGFLLRYESGFTDGTVGFGVDALGQLGLKLDSSPDRTGTGLLKKDSQAGQPAHDNYSDVGLTGKVRISRTVVKYGTLAPRLPMLLANDTRLLPQTFTGTHLTTTELEGLTVDAGRLTQVNQRDSSNNEDMTISKTGIKNIQARATSSDAFDFANINYKLGDNSALGYGFSEFHEFYKQHIVTLNNTLPLGLGKLLKTDLRYLRSHSDNGSNVDNQALAAMLTFTQGGHSIGAGYQRMSGDTGFAYVGGTDAFLPNFLQVSDFANRDEKSWQLRYDFNFVAVGIPGLSLMTRYVSGDGVTVSRNGPEGKEWERDTDIAYVFQSGPFKNLSIKWRNATLRSSHFASDVDENRLIIGYTLPL